MILVSDIPSFCRLLGSLTRPGRREEGPPGDAAVERAGSQDQLSRAGRDESTDSGILSMFDITRLLDSIPAEERGAERVEQPAAGNAAADQSVSTFDGSFVSDAEEAVAEDDEKASESTEEEVAASVLLPEERKVLYIAKEIMTSEKVYVDVLKLLNIDFRNFVQNARRDSKSQLIPTEQFLKLFSNLPELMMLNSDLLKDFEERVQNWSRKKKVADIIVKKGPYLKLYTAYVKNYSAMISHFEECCEKWPKFKKLVREFEKFPQCRNLKLTHYLLKPVQRLPQYKLLLEDYLKHLDTASEDYDDTTTALRIVTDAADHANETIKQMVKTHRNLFTNICNMTSGNRLDKNWY